MKEDARSKTGTTNRTNHTWSVPGQRVPSLSFFYFPDLSGVIVFSTFPQLSTTK